MSKIKPYVFPILFSFFVVVSVWFTMYSFILKAEVDILQAKQIELMEKSIEKENRIKELEKRLEMENYRSTHLQELLNQQEKVMEATLSRSQWKQKSAR
ncbi:MAG: hypothetical protein O9302_04980 [Cyclobacteriaceae bacterium]|jgi:superfamily I DNA and/or RNA helicase|nr:hypothetical protein [Cytophagales bacterium]MCZ8327389.1 hypothetical protein [Cyclobacteriaceae bacterium]